MNNRISETVKTWQAMGIDIREELVFEKSETWNVWGHNKYIVLNGERMTLCEFADRHCA